METVVEVEMAAWDSSHHQQGSVIVLGQVILAQTKIY
jgi:hypothetical protein